MLPPIALDFMQAVGNQFVAIYNFYESNPQILHSIAI